METGMPVHCWIVARMVDHTLSVQQWQRQSELQKRFINGIDFHLWRPLRQRGHDPC